MLKGNFSQFRSRPELLKVVVQVGLVDPDPTERNRAYIFTVGEMMTLVGTRDPELLRAMASTIEAALQEVTASGTEVNDPGRWENLIGALHNLGRLIDQGQVLLTEGSDDT